MVSAASLCQSYNFASHDENATNLCVELLCFKTPMLADTTLPYVLFKLDLQPAQSESVCTVRMVSNISTLSSCVLKILQVVRHSYDSALVLLRWF